MSIIDDLASRHAITAWPEQDIHDGVLGILDRFPETLFLVATVGLPGAGKTTYADALVEQARARGFTAARTALNEAREALGHLPPGGKGVGTTEQEDLVREIHEWHVRGLFDAGVRLVVQDSGNIGRTDLQDLESIADDAGADFVVHDLRGVPVDVCVERDARRPFQVGEHIIRMMARDAGITT